ncbi:hypothetical protein PF003_g26332 [Phytophthora fragariae]|nr:hypothetical protein PF003_g26332 [Phytophthora fragariae]
MATSGIDRIPAVWHMLFLSNGATAAGSCERLQEINTSNKRRLQSRASAGTKRRQKSDSDGNKRQ